MQVKKISAYIFLLGSGYLFIKAGVEFWDIVRNINSPKWDAAFYAAILGMIVFWLAAAAVFFFPEQMRQRFARVLGLRNRFKRLRWLMIAAVLGVLIYLLQYTHYGEIFTGNALRLSLGLVVAAAGGFLLSEGEDIVAFLPFLQSFLVVSAAMAAAVDFVLVRSYPFSQGWSEGNRLWDYSVLFGRRLYDFPQDRSIFSYSDIGRQLIGGLPFLFGNVSIWFARFWWALTDTLLYALFGWILFKHTGEKGKLAVMLGLWTYLFLNQGPIHPPLVVCAILVSLAWGRRYWAAVPLVIAAGYFAQLSRFTWMFAPAMWIFILEFSQPKVEHKPGKSWLRPIALTFAGLTGGVLLPMAINMFSGSSALGSGTQGVGFALTQGLLWYRLLPSATYPQGVALGLLEAITPLIILLVYLLVSGRWKLHGWQKLTMGSVLLAFTVVGLIVSAKIGGGGDLHNLDMLLIGLVFVGAIAWRNGGKDLIVNGAKTSILVQALLVVLVALPGLRYLETMQPYTNLATKEEVTTALDLIQTLVDQVGDGRVLFMDQRQLLTFGYVEAPLLDEYEKKYVMDQALGKNEAYFEDYYQKLAEGYYNLIITEPLHTQTKGSEKIFGEENDAWVTWVSAPTLCFYQQISTPAFMQKPIGIIFLVPKEDTSDCEWYLHPDENSD